MNARKWIVASIAAVAGAAAIPVMATIATADGPVGRAAATCDDYANQAEAQRAADTRDPDGDGVYCESLSCPCLKPGDGEGGGSEPGSPPRDDKSCERPARRVSISFSATKYRNIRRHFRAAVANGWPRTLVLNRPRADERRDRLLEGYPTREGFDRDEYPPAVGRGEGKGLERGRNPRGWKADVAYVPSSENRSHGSTMGTKLRRFCDGTRFRYVFY
jgi:hypothetical protein